MNEEMMNPGTAVVIIGFIFAAIFYGVGNL